VEFTEGAEAGGGHGTTARRRLLSCRHQSVAWHVVPCTGEEARTHTRTKTQTRDPDPDDPRP